jgi:hypothetical protein
MSGKQKKYQAHLTRGLLLAGYLLFFAGQFNYHYFSIANFYVYGNGNSANACANVSATVALGLAHVNTVNKTAETAVVQKTTGKHPVALHDNSQRPSHLGIDKRYQLKQGIRIPQIRAPGVLYVGILKTRFPGFTPVCFSTLPATLSLRGPPCA